MTDKILVFVPAYNCAPQIGRVLAQFTRPAGALVDEILVLDNGSKDGTADAAIAGAGAAEVRRVTIARNRANYNLGGSHKSAFAYADREGFSHVITLHGDDQGRFGDIEPVLRRGDHRRADALMGARFMPGARLHGYSTFRTVGNYVFNLVFSLAARRWITDLGSGLNLVGRNVFADPAIMRLPDDLYFNPYLLLHMFDCDRTVRFFPISWREEDQVSNVRMVSQALKTLGAAKTYALSRGRFRQSDYRQVKHERYAFDVLARLEDGRQVFA